jgi:23S rRNA (adenine2503-C2)-methyltransferase
MKHVLFDDQAIANYAKEKKVQPFKVKQIFYEMYKNQNIDFDDMTTISKDMRAELAEKFKPISLEVDQIKEDKQTTKIWFKTHDGHLIESVIIYHRQPAKHVKNDKPKINRITLCISSQVGCPVNCLFCVTGKLGFQ